MESQPAYSRLFVLIKCEVGRASDVGEQIVDLIEEAQEVYSITGEYDLLVKFILPNLQAMSDLVLTKLHRIPGIKETHTFVSFRVFGEDIGDFVE
ncbi:Lrp/AsnC ligand binding domain-containing protein [Pedomonas mirosovicensis]|uniref:Lrp/AsnC ligand binding domain-containing protein n=1 Tax=Pedomonas mirosovicensis TaxID=2908641 RepID=UPI0021698B31|nr:Lrp/AsnC ligand binding domain-containing protein [Pedomonas mirosovicensis]MCH8684507.1 Lrp/AsnC ligand binding domain-containing protein [Pedomonas mirosovicensis]